MSEEKAIGVVIKSSIISSKSHTFYQDTISWLRIRAHPSKALKVVNFKFIWKEKKKKKTKNVSKKIIVSQPLKKVSSKLTFHLVQNLPHM